MKRFVQVSLFAALLGVFACGSANNNAPAEEEVAVEETVVAVDTLAADTVAADTATADTTVVAQ